MTFIKNKERPLKQLGGHQEDGIPLRQHRKSVYREEGTPHMFSEKVANRGWGHRTYFLNRANRGGGHRTSKQCPSTNYKFG